MVVKTDPCVYTEYKIYPGRGAKFCATDGRVHYSITKKVSKLYHKKTKPVKLTWTQAWRRANKKIKVDEINKKRTRKTTRIQKAFVGVSLEELKKKRAEKPEDRDKQIQIAKKQQ